MYTNQSAETDEPRPPDLCCQHAPGAATPSTCMHLRALGRLRGWMERAEAAQRAGEYDRQLMTELWLLHAEISATFDRCPNASALPLVRRRGHEAS
ncbi:MAG: hypothetical protein IVW57_18645 [Ktedonobacterales bacterium]|nr:hypothetical protein [Ktedonobacterales bacterium]